MAVNDFEKTDEEWGIYPNPFSGQTIIKSNKYKLQRILVRDIIGNVVLQLAVNDYQSVLDMHGFSKGVYFVSIEDETQNMVNRKIVMQ